MNQESRAHSRQQYTRLRREAAARRAWLADAQARKEQAVRNRLSTHSREAREWHAGSDLELAAEGRRMNHCVYSYVWSIQKGQTSIWSMMLEDGKGATGRWAMLTIEVRNDLRRVVQARGRFNRPATSEEHGVLLAWAGQNGLEVSLGRWG
jgi:hypothetical protein